MTTDIKELVKRLRHTVYHGAAGIHFVNQDGPAAADALEAMAGEVERLREACKYDALNAGAIAEIRRACKEIMGDNVSFVDDDFARCLLTLKTERDRLAGEVENLKHDIARHMTIANEAAAERDRLKAALDALEAVRSDLPKKVSEQWLYEGVRHWHRNCDWDDPRDGSPLDRGDGATVAKILNMIPRKALGGDAS